ncbi:MAG: enoyl-CoA hydratase/isomerase family protein [Dehalococcoidia bacterium]|nr:enoyl-CoA hydratase/isomerase family protein [Dehalococcoidia bacterium]MDZ4246492.1 enoyl-CoA hydratase/isomerase family protein [Dehalococcoidia bacterium]
MPGKNILIEKKDKIAWIIFNRPDKLNSWDFPGQGGITDEFQAALDEVEKDDDIKVLILKGNGRAFSAGHDLSTVGFIYGYGTGEQKDERRPSQRVRLNVDREAFAENHRRLFLFPKVTIAQVHGYCIGEGIILMCCCDLAIASEDARLSHSEQRMGFAGSGMGTIPILIATVGLKRAMDILLTGRHLDGKEAERYGLVNKAVSIDKLDEEVLELAKTICLMPRDGIAIGKAHRHLSYDGMGLTTGFTQGYLTHTLFTNLRWEADEYNFFKYRRDDSVRTAIHKRDARYEGGE